MIRLRIARHGEPAWHEDGRAVDDPGLTARGRDEARSLSEVLEGEHFDAIYVSPLKRALETAQPLGLGLGLEPQVCGWLL